MRHLCIRPHASSRTSGSSFESRRGQNPRFSERWRHELVCHPDLDPVGISRILGTVEPGSRNLSAAVQDDASVVRSFEGDGAAAFSGIPFLPLSDRGTGAHLRGPGRQADLSELGSTPAPISVSQLDNLRILVAANIGLVPWPYLNAGQRIQIDRGPLTGVKGFVIRAE